MKRYSGNIDPRKTEVLIRFLLHMTLIWVFCFVLLIPDFVSAKQAPKILLINSDISVEKYRQPQEAFMEVISYPVGAIDLGDKRKLDDIEERLWDEDPDIIYCIGTKAYLIANKYAKKKDIVFSSIINWLRLPVTKTTYGVSNELHAGMEIMLFRFIFPDVQKIGVLYSKKYTGEWFKDAREQAKEMGVEIIGQSVSKKKQAVSAMKKLLPEIDAFWLIPDPVVMSDKDDPLNILKECDAQKIPVFSYHEAFADFGATLVVSPSNPTIGRQAAAIVEEVVAGNTPEEKVQFPAGSYIILHLTKVKEYSLQYNEDAIGSVDETR